MNHVKCLFLIWGGSLISSIAAAQQPTPYPAIPPNATTASLGSFLEQPFELQLGYCITGSETAKTFTLKKALSHDRAISAIPPQLNDPTLNVTSTVYLNNNASVGRAFGYVYTGQSIITPAINGNDYMLVDYLEDPQLMTLTGLNQAIYDYSCSSSIAASLSLNAGWTFPIAQVASALQADSSRKTSYHLALVSGTFYSPFWSLYNSSVSPDWKTYAQMLGWEWYTRHPGAGQDGIKRSVLTQFDGVALYKVMTNSLAVDGKVDAKASLTTPAVSLSAALQASYNSTETVSVNSYQLAVRQVGGKESDHFEDLPSLKVLSSQLSAHAHLDPKSTDLRLQQVPTSHDQLLSGVPPVICSGTWRPEIAPGASLGGVLSLIGSSPIGSPDPSLPPSCRISILFTPTQPAAGQPWPTHVTLSYLLDTDIFDPASATPLTAVATAKFPADPVSLSASGLPFVSASTSLGAVDAGYPKTNDAGGIHFFTYQWTFSYPVQEDTVATEKIATVNAGLSDITLACPAGDRKVLPESGSVSYSGSVLTVTLTHSSDSTKEQLSTSQSELCTLNGRVSFTLANSVAVVRDLPATQTIYPSVISPVVPAPVIAPPVVSPHP
jgi:hypothetical protein